jgi:acetoin utilization protein AcuC
MQREQTRCTARLVWDEQLLGYDFGPQHPLRPERLTYGTDLLAQASLWLPERETIRPSVASREELQVVHAPDYVALVERSETANATDFAGLQRYGLGPGDNPWFPNIHQASARVAGGTVEIARAVMAGDYLHAFNPAGGLHHAMRDRASGFCVYNDVAVAIGGLLQNYDDLRVLYLDFDAHHGDGVQTLFYDDPRVLTFSIHESGRYLFPGTGSVEEIGSGQGRGYSVNLPMEPYTQDDSWLPAVQALVPALAERFEPNIIVSQHGCDGHAWDPLTHLGITTHTIAAQAQLAHNLAHTYCAGRWIATGGGGYDYRRVVPRMYALIFTQMTGRDPGPELPASWRERWAGTGSDALPLTYLDSPTEFPPAPRAEETAARNAETLREATELILAELR